MQGERQHVNKERDDDEPDNTSGNVGAKGGDGHLGVSKLVPEVFSGVKTNKSRDEKANQLDTADTSNANTSEEEPKEPLGLEAVVSLIVEL